MISISEMLDIDYFRSIRVMAGTGGLGNAIQGCAILDYEMDRALSKKFASRNFNPGRLIITSLMFAKDNPFLISEAVKHVISIGASGLIIKNVYRLPIHDTVLRYADFRNFPIMLMDDDMYFDSFIVKLNKYLEADANSEEDELKLEQLLYGDLGETAKKELARQTFTFFRDRYTFLYCGFDPESQSEKRDTFNRISKLQFPVTVKAVTHGEKGFFLFLTTDRLTEDTVSECADILSGAFPESRIGLSEIRYWIKDVDLSLKEALYASMIGALDPGVSANSSRNYIRYSDIGIYKVLLPISENETIRAFSESIISPIIAFDAENHGNLLETLLRYIKSGGNLKTAAELSLQHENTIRYRLDRIADVTGLSYKRPADYEQLALAARVYMLLRNQFVLSSERDALFTGSNR